MISTNEEKGVEELSNGYLLDTDVLIGFLRGRNKALKQEFERVLHKDIPLFMSIITLGELYVGAFKSDNTRKNMFLVNSLKDKVEILELNEEIILLYGEIEAVLEKAGKKIGDFDVLIASTAMNYNLTLMSGNKRHFGKVVNLFGQLDFEQWSVN